MGAAAASLVGLLARTEPRLSSLGRQPSHCPDCTMHSTKLLPAPENAPKRTSNARSVPAIPEECFTKAKYYCTQYSHCPDCTMHSTKLLPAPENAPKCTSNARSVPATPEECFTKACIMHSTKLLPAPENAPECTSNTRRMLHKKPNSTAQNIAAAQTTPCTTQNYWHCEHQKRLHQELLHQ